MAKRGFLARHGILRNAIRKDIPYFVLPWLTVLCIEALFCTRDLIKEPQSLSSFRVEGIIGLALFIIGFVVLLVGHVTLWRNYSSFLVIHKDHQLITRGIYRFTRNPIYLGTLMALIGLPVYAASLYGFLTSLFMIPIFLYRIRLEEGLLAEEFQEAFQKYKKSTKRLVPFIY
ncbi:methyltransferase family protein [Chloroflexota bacterium]